MVFDHLSHASQYRLLSPTIARAFDFIATADLSAIATGRHQIQGDEIYLLLNEYQTKPVEECRWEAHRRYIDVQVLLKGVERMGVNNITNMRQQPYDPEKDVIWMQGDGNLLTFPEGSFMIFWPQDAHKPGVMVESPATVRKAVIKIAVSE